MRVKYSSLILIIILFSISVKANAQDISPFDLFSKDTELVPGGPWDPYNPNDNKVTANCFEYSTEYLDNGIVPIISEIDVKSDFIDNLEKLTHVTKKSVSAIAEANYSSISGEASYNKFQKKSVVSNSRNVVWALHGYREYNSDKTSKFDLTDRGKNVLKRSVQENNIESFFETCGRSYVGSTKRGASLAVVYTFTTSDETKTNEIKESISASVNTPYAGGGVKRDFIEDIRKVDSSVSFTVSAFQTGGKDFSKNLDALLTSKPGDLDEIRQLVKGALSEMSYESSPVVYWSLQPISSNYSDLRGRDGFDRYEQYKRIRSVLENQKIELKQRLDILENILKASKRKDLLLTLDGDRVIDQKIKEINKSIDRLSKSIADCLRSRQFDECADDSKEDFDLKIMKYAVPPLASFHGWSEELQSDVGDGLFYYAGVFHPVVKFNNPLLIQKIILKKNELTIAEYYNPKIDDVINQNSEVIEFRTAHLGNEPCSKSNYSNCIRDASNRKSDYLATVRVKEANHAYEMLIYDIDGGEHVLNLGNALSYSK